MFTSFKLWACRGLGPDLIWQNISSVVHGTLYVLCHWTNGREERKEHLIYNETLREKKWLAGARDVLVAPEFSKWNIVWNLMRKVFHTDDECQPHLSQPKSNQIFKKFSLFWSICLSLKHTLINLLPRSLSTCFPFHVTWSNLSAPSFPHFTPYRHLVF